MTNWPDVSKILEVVYVDDEADNIYHFDLNFSQIFKLKTFTNPTEALNYVLTSNRVGVLITDQSMPIMTGYDLAKKILQQQEHIKCIMITGNPDHEENLMYNSLKEHMFFNYFSKPIDFYGDKDYYQNIIKKCLQKAYESIFNTNQDKALSLLTNYPVLASHLDSVQSYLQGHEKEFPPMEINKELDCITITVHEDVNDLQHYRFKRVDELNWNLERKINESWIFLQKSNLNNIINYFFVTIAY